jgi:hypothetical protein
MRTIVEVYHHALFLEMRRASAGRHDCIEITITLGERRRDWTRLLVDDVMFRVWDMGRVCNVWSMSSRSVEVCLKSRVMIGSSEAEDGERFDGDPSRGRRWWFDVSGGKIWEGDESMNFSLARVLTDVQGVTDLDSCVRSRGEVNGIMKCAS